LPCELYERPKLRENGIMADTFRLKIDLALLAENLSRADGKPQSQEDVAEWLRGNHFIPQGDWWVCEEISLGLLDKSEIIEMHEFT
jgi:hypothetical protein